MAYKSKTSNNRGKKTAKISTKTTSSKNAVQKLAPTLEELCNNNYGMPESVVYGLRMELGLDVDDLQMDSADKPNPLAGNNPFNYKVTDGGPYLYVQHDNQTSVLPKDKFYYNNQVDSMYVQNFLNQYNGDINNISETDYQQYRQLFEPKQYVNYNIAEGQERYAGNVYITDRDTGEVAGLIPNEDFEYNGKVDINEVQSFFNLYSGDVDSFNPDDYQAYRKQKDAAEAEFNKKFQKADGSYYEPDQVVGPIDNSLLSEEDRHRLELARMREEQAKKNAETRAEEEEKYGQAIVDLNSEKDQLIQQQIENDALIREMQKEINNLKKENYELEKRIEENRNAIKNAFDQKYFENQTPVPEVTKDDLKEIQEKYYQRLKVKMQIKADELERKLIQNMTNLVAGGTIIDKITEISSSGQDILSVAKNAAGELLSTAAEGLNNVNSVVNQVQEAAQTAQGAVEQAKAAGAAVENAAGNVADGALNISAQMNDLKDKAAQVTSSTSSLDEFAYANTYDINEYDLSQYVADQFKTEATKTTTKPLTTTATPKTKPTPTSTDTKKKAQSTLQKNNSSDAAKKKADEAKKKAEEAKKASTKKTTSTTTSQPKHTQGGSVMINYNSGSSIALMGTSSYTPSQSKDVNARAVQKTIESQSAYKSWSQSAKAGDSITFNVANYKSWGNPNNPPSTITATKDKSGKITISTKK